MSVIPEGSTILMTGTTGCVGAGIVLEVLKAGFKIRAAVRKPEKAKLFAEAYNKRYPGAFDTVLVKDNRQPGAFDEVLQVIHAAGGIEGNDLDAVQSEVDTILGIARSASKVASVKRFVFTSSTNALTRSMVEPGHLTVSSWNDEAVEAIKAPRSTSGHDWNRVVDIYSAGKVLAERALFDFVKEHKPGFVANTILPNFNIGENITSTVSSSNSLVVGVATKNPQRIQLARGLLPQFFVSLVDDGLLHLAALTQEDVQNERIIAATTPFNMVDLLAILERLGYKDLLTPIAGKDDVRVGKTIDNSRSLELLKRYGKDSFDDMEPAVQLCVSTAPSAGDSSISSQL